MLMEAIFFFIKFLIRVKSQSIRFIVSDVFDFERVKVIEHKYEIIHST